MMRETGTPRFLQETQAKRSLQESKPINPVALQTTATTIYTAPSDSDFWVVHLWAANVTASSETYTLYFVPAGGTAGTPNTAVFQRVLPANSSEVIDVAVNHRIEPSAIIQAVCSTNDAINIGGWGYDQRGEYA